MAKDKTFKPQDLDKLSAHNTTFFGASYRTKQYDRKKLTKRLIAILIILVFIILLITWLIAYIILNGGSFTVRIENAYVTTLSLSRTPEFDENNNMISTPAKNNMKDYGARNIPTVAGLLTDGGEYYIHSQFYIRNDSADTPLSFQYSIGYSSATNGIENAARIMVIRSVDTDGYDTLDYKVYAAMDANGRPSRISYPGRYDENNQFVPYSEEELAEYPELLENELFSYAETIDPTTRTGVGTVEDIAPGEFQRFDVVIWLEGSDPECTDDILNSRIKYEMTILA